MKKEVIEINITNKQDNSVKIIRIYPKNYEEYLSIINKTVLHILKKIYVSIDMTDIRDINMFNHKYGITIKTF